METRFYVYLHEPFKNKKFQRIFIVFFLSKTAIGFEN